MPASLSRISFNVRPLCTSALLSLAGSRLNHTLPLALEASKKLLYHSNVSSMPKGTICCFCSLSGAHILPACGVHGMAGCQP